MQVYTNSYSAIYNSGVYQNSYNTQNTSLSEEEQAQVADILSQYDPENLSEEDIRAIRDTFREQGITPGASLDSAVEEAGFSVDAIRGAGGPPPGGMPPPPPPSASEEEEYSLLDYLSSLDSEERSSALDQLSTLSTEGYEAIRSTLDAFQNGSAEMSAEEKTQSFSELLSSIFSEYQSGSLGGSSLVDSVALDYYA